MSEENPNVEQAKNELISLVSHQLRTPLTTIKWYIEALVSKDTDNLTEKQRQYLDQIYQSNERMVKLIESLLNVSRLELGTFHVETETLQIADIANANIKELQPQLKEKGAKLSVDIQDAMPQIEADKKMLGIIFQNLLSNAVKYSADENGEIRFKLAMDKENIYIEVEDNGYGIPVAQQNQIFSKLFRADNVKERVSNGTGLGLYLVKKIIDQSKGTITFKSEEDKGTLFKIALPIKSMKQITPENV